MPSPTFSNVASFFRFIATRRNSKVCWIRGRIRNTKKKSCRNGIWVREKKYVSTQRVGSDITQGEIAYVRGAAGAVSLCLGGFGRTFFAKKKSPEREARNGMIRRVSIPGMNADSQGGREDSASEKRNNPGQVASQYFTAQRSAHCIPRHPQIFVTILFSVRALSGLPQHCPLSSTPFFLYCNHYCYHYCYRTYCMYILYVQL